MKQFIVFAALFLISVSQTSAQKTTERTDVLGLENLQCPDSYCDGKADGNYEYSGDSKYILSCSGGVAQCQACWPANLVFSEQCNQCLYHKDDACTTTQKWVPMKSYDCPDMCGKMGPQYEGNMADPVEHHHYVACWQGVTVGCVTCPGNLMFNEKENACLYEGKHFTEPTVSK